MQGGASWERGRRPGPDVGELLGGLDALGGGHVAAVHARQLRQRADHEQAVALATSRATESEHSVGEAAYSTSEVLPQQQPSHSGQVTLQHTRVTLRGGEVTLR